MSVHIQRTESDVIARELVGLQDAIRQRAYALYERTGSSDELDNWLTAEREVVRRPVLETHEEPDEVEVLVAFEDVDPAGDLIEVQVAPLDVLICADPLAHTRRRGRRINGGSNGLSLREGSVIGAVHFNTPIDPATLHAEYRAGGLRLTAMRG